MSYLQFRNEPAYPRPWSVGLFFLRGASVEHCITTQAMENPPIEVSTFQALAQ